MKAHCDSLFCCCLSVEIRAGSTWPQHVIEILARGSVWLVCVFSGVGSNREQERDQDLSQEIL